MLITNDEGDTRAAEGCGDVDVPNGALAEACGVQNG